MQRPDDVGIDVGVRVLHAVAHAGLGAEMDHPLRSHLGEEPLHARPVGEIQLVEGKAGGALKLAEPRLLQLYVVIGIEVIEPDDLVASVEQRLGGMVTDEPGRAGDQDTHRHIPCVWSNPAS